MFHIDALLNRLDQLEAKNEQHEAKLVEHELKINNQQIEIDQLKKKNFDLEEKNNQLILAKNDHVTSRDFLPRSCFELKATNPSAQSGVYSIDPDGQIGADQPIQVYCDMTTRIIVSIAFKSLTYIDQLLMYINRDYFNISRH